MREKIRERAFVLMMTIVMMMTAAMTACPAFAEMENTSIPEELETQEPETQEPAPDFRQSGERSDNDNEKQGQRLLEQVKEMLPIVFGTPAEDTESRKEWFFDQVKKLRENPRQYSENFWDSLFGTGAEGISKEEDAEEKGKIVFVMDLPDPVEMPDTYSVSYCRLDDKKNEVVTLLERDAEGNIHYLDGENECVFVRTDEGFHMYPVLADRGGFGEWDGVLLSARSVRSLTNHFWNCADQTFIKWLGAEFVEATEYLGRNCGMYHAQPGAITFTYECDMIIDDETGICLLYTADELMKGVEYNITEDGTIEVSIGEYDIGGDEMSFYCTEFRTEDISFELPAR